MAASSSSEETPEYRIMREYNGMLVELLYISVEKLGDALFAKQIISLDVKKKLRNTTQSEENRTREAIECIISKVKHNSQVFHDFVDLLKELDHQDIPDKLLTNYHSQPITHPTVFLSHSQIPLSSQLSAAFKCIADVNRLISLQEYQNTESPLSEERHNTQSQTNTELVIGTKDMVLLVSKVSGHDVVPRRHRAPLTEEEIQELQEQGIHEDCCINDLTIMLAREELDKKTCTSAGVLTGEQRTCEEVRQRITELFNTTDKEGVMLHYIGPGQRETGNWCFKDGFISFEEIMELYTQHFKPRGRILTIVSDCSYSGRWVKEAMTFMDEQGVGPCGHEAKEKGIFVKVIASCLANEVPAELAFSTQNIKNTDTGNILYIIHFKSKKIYDNQHPIGIDFTEVICNNKLEQPCTMAPHSTWKQWGDGMRTYTLKGKDKSKGEIWQCIKVNDDKKPIQDFEDEVKKSGEVKINDEWGEVLRSGRGEIPKEMYDNLLNMFAVDYRPSLNNTTETGVPTTD